MFFIHLSFQGARLTAPPSPPCSRKSRSVAEVDLSLLEDNVPANPSVCGTGNGYANVWLGRFQVDGDTGVSVFIGYCDRAHLPLPAFWHSNMQLVRVIGDYETRAAERTRFPTFLDYIDNALRDMA